MKPGCSQLLCEAACQTSLTFSYCTEHRHFQVVFKMSTIDTRKCLFKQGHGELSTTFWILLLLLLFFVRSSDLSLVEWNKQRCELPIYIISLNDSIWRKKQTWWGCVEITTRCWQLVLRCFPWPPYFLGGKIKGQLYSLWHKLRDGRLQFSLDWDKKITS